MSNHSTPQRITTHLRRIVNHRALAGQPTFRMTDRDLERGNADLAALGDRDSKPPNNLIH